MIMLNCIIIILDGMSAASKSIVLTRSLVMAANNNLALELNAARLVPLTRLRFIHNNKNDGDSSRDHATSLEAWKC